MPNNDTYGGLDPNVRTSIREILNGLNVAIKKDIQDSQNNFNELLRMRGESKLLESQINNNAKNMTTQK